MKVITQRDVIRTVPARFREQYSFALDVEAAWKPGSTRRDIAAALDALDIETCTTTDIDHALGVTGWADNKCDECGASNRPVLVRLGEEPDYDARWIDLCPSCLAEAALMIGDAA